MATSPPLHQHFPRIVSVKIDADHLMYTCSWARSVNHLLGDVNVGVFASFVTLDVCHVRNLRFFDLARAPCLSAITVASLCQCNRLESVILPSAVMPAETLRPLAALPHLELLGIGTVPCNDESLEHLAALTRLMALRW